MKETQRTKRRILTAGAGMAAFTVVEGIACGNPVAPRHDMRPEATEPVSTVAPTEDAAPEAPASAPTGQDGGVSDAGATPK